LRGGEKEGTAPFFFEKGKKENLCRAVGFKRRAWYPWIEEKGKNEVESPRGGGGEKERKIPADTGQGRKNGRASPGVLRKKKGGRQFSSSEEKKRETFLSY